MQTRILLRRNHDGAVVAYVPDTQEAMWEVGQHKDEAVQKLIRTRAALYPNGLNGVTVKWERASC